MPTKYSLSTLAIIILMLGLGPASLRADSFTWTDVGAGITSASGTITAHSVGGGQYIVDSGTAMFNGDSMNLFAGADNGSIQTSPAGLFLFDNVLFLGSNPLLDVDGLLFVDSFGSELNIWGNGTPGSYSTYTGVGGGYPLQNTASLFTIVPTVPTPEPSAIVLLIVGLTAFSAWTWRAMQKNTLAEASRPLPRR